MCATMEAELNTKQQKCADSSAEWLLISGSAGTGKSLALCRRAKRLLEAGESVLFITGTTRMLDKYTNMLSNGKFKQYEENKQCVFGRKNSIYSRLLGISVNYSEDGKVLKDKSDKEIKEFYDNLKKYEGFHNCSRDHVLIDEAQDFLIEELYFFAQLAKKSLTLVASTAQDIFAQKNDNWEKKRERLEEICGKSFVKLDIDIQMRMSAEILTLANDIGSKIDAAVMTDANAVSRGLPKIVMCNSEDEELEELKDLVGSINTNERRVGVIINKDKGKRNLEGIKQMLEDTGAKAFTDEMADSGLWVINVANAKGIEFDDVILFLDNDTFFCDHYKKGSGSKDLYVAITRACSGLIMIADVNNRSGYIGNSYNRNTPVFAKDHYETFVHS